MPRFSQHLGFRTSCEQCAQTGTPGSTSLEKIFSIKLRSKFILGEKQVLPKKELQENVAVDQAKDADLYDVAKEIFG